MALRSPLTVQPYDYIADSNGRPLDYGQIYIGVANQDPEFYQIPIYLDAAMTKPVDQPIRTNDGFVDFAGSLSELYASAEVYSVKVLDKEGRKVLYKGEMTRKNLMSDALADLNQSIIDMQTAAQVTLNAAVNSANTEVAQTVSLATAAIDTATTKSNKAATDADTAIKTLFENGGLPATPFKTKVLMTASALVDGDYAMVTDDTTNNGLYVKTAGAWVKSAYDPFVLSKNYTDNHVGKASVVVKHPVIVDTIGNIPLWINGGRLGFTEFDAETKDRVMRQIKLGKVNKESITYPVISDNEGNIPLWIHNGLVNFAGIHPDAVKLIEEGLTEKIVTDIRNENNTTNAAYPIVSDGASLFQFKAKAARVKKGINQRLSVVMTGDSWAELSDIPNEVKLLLSGEYGLLGSGWINVLGNHQMDGITLSKTGSWTVLDLSNNPSFPLGCAPDGFAATSATVGDFITLKNLVKGDNLSVFFGKTSGSFTYSVNSGAEELVTVSSSGADVQSVVIPVIAESTVVLKVVSGSVSFFGMHMRKSTGSGAELNKMGNGGSTGRNYKINSPSSQINFSNYLNPDLVVIMLGTNDYRGGDSVQDYKLGISAMIDGYRSSNSDCGFILVAPADTNATAIIPLTQFRDAIYEIAQDKGVEFYNMHDDWSAWSAENTNGQWKDPLHVSPAGAYRVANKLFKNFMEV